MTDAEIQERILALVQEGEEARGLTEEAAADLSSARNRLVSLADMMKAARAVGNGPDVEQAEWEARNEARYWLAVYCEASPRMRAQRDRLEEVRVQVRKLSAEARTRGLELGPPARGRVGNPPGASPSMDLKS